MAARFFTSQLKIVTWGGGPVGKVLQGPLLEHNKGRRQEFMDGKPPLRQHIKLIVDMGYSFWEMLDGITGEELTNDARLFRQEDTTKYAPLVLGAAKMLIKEANARMGTGEDAGL
eukprot:gene17613-20978_t